MSFTRGILLCGLALFAFASSVFAQEGKPESTYLTKEGLLRSKFSITELQSGFAGETGTVTSFHTDGTWQVANVMNQKVGEPTKSGTLTAEQNELLGKLLTEHFKPLPASFGNYNGANPKSVTLTFGANACHGKLSPGQSVQEAAGKAKGNVDAVAWENVFAIEEAIKALTVPVAKKEAPTEKTPEEKPAE